MERILLDTAYLLPIIGISVKKIEKTLSVLEKLYRSNAVEIYYTCFNIFEIIGKLSRVKYDERIVEAGLTSITENFKQAFPTTQSYLKALKLRSMGFKDLIDLLLYTTSAENNLKMLTRDTELIEFLQKTEEKRLEAIILEDKFLETHELK